MYATSITSNAAKVEPPHFKFANEASLKQIKAAFDISFWKCHQFLEMTKQHL